MKVVAYLRVSTDRQVEEGLGLEVQEQAIRQWARSNKHRVVLWARDEGVSGSNGLDTRQGLLVALAALQEGKAAGLVVFRLDRLARELVVQENLLAELKRVGADVFSTSAAESAYITDDDADPSRKLIRQVLGAVAEYEKAMTVFRLRLGRERKHATGGYAGRGSPPFGWRSVNGALVHDPEEQKALALIRRLRTADASYRSIAEALTTAGYKPRGKRHNGRAPSGRWHPETIRKIVERDAA